MKWHKPAEKRPLCTCLLHQVADAQLLKCLYEVSSPSHFPRMLVPMTTWSESQHLKSAATTRGWYSIWLETKQLKGNDNIQCMKVLRDSPLSILTWQENQVHDAWLSQAWLSKQLGHLQLNLTRADLATVFLSPWQHLGALSTYPDGQNQLTHVNVLCSSLLLLTILPLFPCQSILILCLCRWCCIALVTIIWDVFQSL